MPLTNGTMARAVIALDELYMKYATSLGPSPVSVGYNPVNGHTVWREDWTEAWDKARQALDELGE